LIVYDDIVELCKRFKVTDIGFDPYRADDYVNALYDEHQIICTLVPQKESVLTQASQIFQRGVLGGSICFLDPVTAWMARNVDLTPSKFGGVKPQKPKSEEGDTKDSRMKIDGVSSCVNAIQRWKTPDPQEESFRSLQDSLSRAADERAAGQTPTTKAIFLTDTPSWLKGI